MFASLRTRLTIAYFLVAGLLLAVVAIVGTVFILTMYARATDESISAAVGEAPAIVKLVGGDTRPLHEAAPQIIARLERAGLRVMVFDDGVPGQIPPGPANAPPQFSMVAPHGVLVERENGVVKSNPVSGRMLFPAQFGRRNDFWRHLFAEMGNALFGLRPQFVRVPGGAVNVLPDLDRFRTIVLSAVVTMSAAGLCMALIALVLGKFITDQALTPLVEVTESLRRLARGDFSPRSVVTNQRNEMGELATAFNAAADQVVAALDERERNARHMRQFIADAGHELRTPLTVVMGYLDVLQRGAIADRDLSENILRTMGEESRRMRAVIDKLIFLARLDRAEMQQPLEAVDVAEIAGKIVEKFAPLAPSGLRFERNGSAWVIGDPVEIHEAISNIVDNALKYAPDAPIDVRVAADDGRVAVAIKDRGPGMTAEEQAHAFDRFFRGDRRFEVEGSGLGLAIAKSAVERAHGTLRLYSAPGAGSEFTIELPRAE